MPRTFDSTDDEIQTAIGAGDVAEPMTYVAIIRRTTDTDAQRAFLGRTNSGLSGRGRLQIFSTGNRLNYANTVGNGDSTFTVVSSENWVLVAGSKAAGTAKPRLHKYVYDTDAWTHADSGDPAFGDGSTPGSSGLFRLGLTSSMDIQIAGFWARVLSDAEVEQLALTLQGWLAAAPTAAWLFDQSLTTQKLVDWTGGGANESSIVGTSVPTASAPIFSYGHPLLYPNQVADAAPAGQPTMRRWGGVPHLGGAPPQGRSW